MFLVFFFGCLQAVRFPFCFRQAATLAKLGFCISVTGHAHSLRGRTYLFLGGERTTHPRDFIFWGREGLPGHDFIFGGQRATHPRDSIFGGRERRPFPELYFGE